MSEELCARLECIEKLVLVLTAQRNQLQENVVEMESAKLKARNATVLIEAERDQLRARVAELENKLDAANVTIGGQHTEILRLKLARSE